MLYLHCRVFTAESVQIWSDLDQFNLRKEEEKQWRALLSLHFCTTLGSDAEQFSGTKRKSLVPTPSHWLLCRFRLIASVTIGAILELVTPSPPCLPPRLLWQELLWMEEWPLWEWVSPQGQLGDIIRQDSYRRTHAFNQSCCFLAEAEAYLQEFSKFLPPKDVLYFPFTLRS